MATVTWLMFEALSAVVWLVLEDELVERGVQRPSNHKPGVGPCCVLEGGSIPSQNQPMADSLQYLCEWCWELQSSAEAKGIT